MNCIHGVLRTGVHWDCAPLLPGPAAANELAAIRLFLGRLGLKDEDSIIGWLRAQCIVPAASLRKLKAEPFDPAFFRHMPKGEDGGIDFSKRPSPDPHLCRCGHNLIDHSKRYYVSRSHVDFGACFDLSGSCFDCSCQGFQRSA